MIETYTVRGIRFGSRFVALVEVDAGKVMRAGYPLQEFQGKSWASCRARVVNGNWSFELTKQGDVYVLHPGHNQKTHTRRRGKGL